MNDHSDHDLPSAEADRLELLLRRAAERVPVDPAPSRAIAPSPPTRSHHRRLLAVAAAVLLVAALGGTWWLASDDGQRIDAGPADPPEVTELTIAPRVLEQTGVSRLPEGLDGYELVAAQETGFSSGWGGSGPGRLVVDDPADPRRWMLVQAYNEFGVAPATARAFSISDEVRGFTVTSGPPGATDAPIWFQVDPVAADAVVSGAVFGVGEAELVGALGEIFESSGNLMPGEGFDASVEMLTERFGMTEGERIDWAGDDSTRHGSSESRPSIELTLMGDPQVSNPGDGPGGPEVVVQIAGTDGAPAWAQLLRFELTADLSSIAATEQGLGGSPTYTMRRRPDLGRNVVETRSALSGVRTPPMLIVFTDDGVMLSANLATTATEIGTDGLSETEQLRILNRLVSFDEAEFLQRLTDAGIEFVGAGGSPDGAAGSAGPATTTVDAPG